MAADYAEAEVIADRLHRLLDGLQAFLELDPAPEQRERMRERACEMLAGLFATEVESEAAKKLLGKIEGGLDHRLGEAIDLNCPYKIVYQPFLFNQAISFSVITHPNLLFCL